MTSWQEINRANQDGSLDHASLPDLIESRRTLSGVINVHHAQARVVIAHLVERVADLIKRREQEERDKANAASEADRHSQLIAVEQKKVDVSEKALKVSQEANEISERSNEISHRAHGWAIVAIVISLLAVAISSCQWYVDRTSVKSHNEPLELLKQEATPRMQPTNIVPLSIATNATPIQQKPK